MPERLSSDPGRWRWLPEITLRLFHSRPKHDKHTYIEKRCVVLLRFSFNVQEALNSHNFHS